MAKGPQKARPHLRGHNPLPKNNRRPDRNGQANERDRCGVGGGERGLTWT